MKFDHIGVFVSNIEQGWQALASLFLIQSSSEVFEDSLLQVKVQFVYDSSGICYELVAPFGPKNPVDVVLKTRKNVLNHVAYRVTDFDTTLQRLRDEGAFLLGEAKPAIAFKGKRVVFLCTTLNFVMELIEE